MIKIQKHSGIYTLTSSQTLDINIEKAWDFFSSPKNLKKITPKHMGFVITSDLNENMYPGQIITYKINVLPKIKTNWVTEITQVNPLKSFIDEQRFGPYSMWHHEHFFKSLDSGQTLILDKISYKIPFGWIGQLVHHIFIKNQLKKIFQYRFDVIPELI